MCARGRSFRCAVAPSAWLCRNRKLERSTCVHHAMRALLLLLAVVYATFPNHCLRSSDSSTVTFPRYSICGDGVFPLSCAARFVRATTVATALHCISLGAHSAALAAAVPRGHHVGLPKPTTGPVWPLSVRTHIATSAATLIRHFSVRVSSWCQWNSTWYFIFTNNASAIGTPHKLCRMTCVALHSIAVHWSVDADTL